MTVTKFILLNKADNVVICCLGLKVGETISIDKKTFNLATPIEVGHKIAKKGIKKGQKVIRYGVSIGSAITDIQIGEHVHMHNMRSDYISSHTRQSKVGE